MKKLLGKFRKHSRRGEKGFTLVELLVVIAILGVVAAIAIPNVGRFIGRGQTEAYATELQNIEVAVMALLAESDAGVLTGAVSATDDMDNVTALVNSSSVALSEFLTGLDSDNKVKTGATYAFTTDGTVTQTTP